jgi:hypothetical protein
MSRIVRAPGDPLDVGQKDHGRLLLFRFPVEVVLALDAESQQVIRFQSVSDNVKNKSGNGALRRKRGARARPTACAVPRNSGCRRSSAPKSWKAMCAAK